MTQRQQEVNQHQHVGNLSGAIGHGGNGLCFFNSQTFWSFSCWKTGKASPIELQKRATPSLPPVSAYLNPSIPSLTILINHTPRSRPIHQERRRRIPRHQRRLLDAPPKPNLLEMDAPPQKRHRNAPQQTPPSSRPNTCQTPHHSPLTTSGNRKPQPLPSRRLPQSPLPRDDPQTPS